MMQRREPKEVRGFLKDFEKLFTSKDDGILSRITKERIQLVLPKNIGAISFYRITREHGSSWQRPNSAFNTRPVLLA